MIEQDYQKIKQECHLLVGNARTQNPTLLKTKSLELDYLQS